MKYFPRKTKNSKKTTKPTVKQIATAIADATTQLTQYQNDELVTQFIDDGKKLQKVILIFHGWELIKCITVD